MSLAIIYYCIIIINILVYLSGKQSKVVSIPSALFLILFVMGKRFDRSFIAYDLESYALRYDNVADHVGLEYGYKFLEIIGNSLGLSFDAFYMILVACIMIAILVSVNRLGGNLHLFIACWLIYFVLVSMDQLRNQSALAIVIATIIPFYTEKGQKSLRWVITCLLIATLFHSSFILYLVPLLMSYKKNLSFKYARGWFFVFMIIFFVLMATHAGSWIASSISLLIKMGGDESKYGGYISDTTGLSSLASLAIYFVSLISIYLLRKTNRNFSGVSYKFTYEKIDHFLKFLFFSSCLLPFLLVNASFYRIVRDLSFITIAYLGINSTGRNSSFMKRFQSLLFSMVISVGWFIFDIIIKGYVIDYSQNFFNNVILK